MKEEKGDIFSFDREPEMPKEQSLLEKIILAIKKVFVK